MFFFFLNFVFASFILLHKANAMVKTNLLWQSSSKGTKMNVYILQPY